MEPRKQLGISGENLAAQHLKRKGYKIRAKNFSCPLGEIDIIAEKGNYLVFCEIKTRKDKQFGHPFEAVSQSKQEKLKKVAFYYFTFKTDQKLSCRFDVISIEVINGHPHVEHLENAFW